MNSAMRRQHGESSGCLSTVKNTAKSILILNRCRTWSLLFVCLWCQDFFECVLNCLLTCSSWSNSIERLLYHFCLEMSNYKLFTRIRAFVAVAHICSDLWDRCFLASSYWLLCTRCCVIIFFVS